MNIYRHINHLLLVNGPKAVQGGRDTTDHPKQHRLQRKNGDRLLFHRPVSRTNRRMPVALKRTVWLQLPVVLLALIHSSI